MTRPLLTRILNALGWYEVWLITSGDWQDGRPETIAVFPSRARADEYHAWMNAEVAERDFGYGIESRWLRVTP